MTAKAVGIEADQRCQVKDKGDGRCGNVSEDWAVNGRETLGPSVPSVVTDHESGWPISECSSKCSQKGALYGDADLSPNYRKG